MEAASQATTLQTLESCPAVAASLADDDVIQVDDDDDDLDHLTTEELKKQVKQLKTELTNVKGRLYNFEILMEDLPGKREVLVKALSLVVSLISVNSVQTTETRTISCSAIPSRIDGDWENKLISSEPPRKEF